ncbi:MAG: MlaE family ABC transporter permease [Rhizobiaceae bacterium]
MTETETTEPVTHAEIEDIGAGDAVLDIEKGSVLWTLHGSGAWTMGNIHEIDDTLREVEAGDFPAIRLVTDEIDHFDTGGAWLIERLRRTAKRRGRSFEHIDSDLLHRKLVEVMRPHERSQEERPGIMQRFTMRPVENLGRAMAGFGTDFIMGCNLIGASLQGSQMKSGKRGGIRVTSIVHQLDHMGLKAVPVITVMSFLIGAIIAQQGAFQLKAFGEELLTVNLVGILLLREIGVLLTAVMVAGRTGSAITAEIGTMKMREEVDALKVIGLNPVGVLILPRLIALIVALPILTLLSDISGLAGAIMVGDLYIGITPQQFLQALQANVSIEHFWIGIIKAPFMAVIIGLVAAIEGLKVGGSAESLGQHTTAAVVRAIFAVILVDGLFAIFYASLGY